MNNKYIDNKLKAFRKRFPDSVYMEIYGTDIEQFIKEALESVEKQTREEDLRILTYGEGIVYPDRINEIRDKLKSEQEPEEKRQEEVTCKDSEGNKCNEGIVDFQGNMVVVREGTLITLTHCFPQNGMFFGLKEAQFNKVRDYLSKMIGELLYTQASDDKEQP